MILRRNPKGNDILIIRSASSLFRVVSRSISATSTIQHPEPLSHLLACSVLHIDGHFMILSDEDIRDKSKTDLFAKALVILQVTWLLLQCVSRKVSDLSLAPLEVRTLVHAGCAMVMYSPWFHKPLDVRTATLVPTSRMEDLLALLVMQSKYFNPSVCN